MLNILFFKSADERRDCFVVQDVAAEVGVDVAVMIRGDDARAVQSRVEVIVFLESKSGGVLNELRAAV